MQLESLAEWKKRAQASRLAAVLPASQGSIFKITPTGVFTELHDFNHLATNNDGDNPYAGLILGSDGNFYGTTVHGGVYGAGAIFRITRSGTYTPCTAPAKAVTVLCCRSG